MEPNRVVRTRVPIGPDLWVFGSGYLVAAGRVLTAGHVLAEEPQEPHLGQLCEVRVWPCGEDQPWCEGEVAWLHPSADAAVVAVEGLGLGLTAVPWGRLDGSEPVDCTATGYPIAALEQDREEEQVTGFVAPGSKESSGGLVMTVESRSAQSSPLGETGWAGLSGAAVFSGRYLIGIVTTDPVQWARSLEGIRSSVLIDDPDLAVCTGAAVAD